MSANYYYTGLPSKVTGRRIPKDQPPYASSAPEYLAKGWSPIPVDPDSKKAEVRGYHGGSAKPVTEMMVNRWIRRFPDANVALVLPDNVIGIDVDAYDGKPGRKTLEKLISDLGPLPETWVSTARSDGISGIRLYRVKPGLSWPGQAGPGIDIIHSGNRYVIVTPSLHANGNRYRWYPGDQKINSWSTRKVPSPCHLPWLPAEWVEYLSLAPGADSAPGSGNPLARRFSLAALHEALKAFGSGESCEQIAGIADRAVRDIAAGASAHDTALNAVWGILADFAKGHRGPNRALAQVHQAFVSAPGPRQRARTAEEEFRALALGIAPPGWDRPPTDPCRVLQGLSARPAPVGLTPERIQRLKARKRRK
jgi:hypothetical protein